MVAASVIQMEQMHQFLQAENVLCKQTIHFRKIQQIVIVKQQNQQERNSKFKQEQIGVVIKYLRFKKALEENKFPDESNGYNSDNESISGNATETEQNLTTNELTGENLIIDENIDNNHIHQPEATTSGVLWKKVFLEMSQNSQENTCARVSFLIKLQASGLRPATLLKKRLWHWCFPVNFVTFLRTPFLQNTSSDCF